MRIVSDIMTPSSADVRLVLFLNEKELSAHYLKAGGGKEVIDLMEDSELQELARGTGNSRIVRFPAANFDLANLLKPPANFSSSNRAVLIDVPKALISELDNLSRRAASAMASAPELEKLREHLKKLMSHNYYIVTLNIPKAKKLTGMTRNKDLEKWVEAFDPNVISNYPVKQVLVAAKDEWDEAHDTESQEEERVKSKEEKAKRAERERAADDTLSGATAQALEARLVNTLIAAGTKSISDIADDIRSMLRGSNEQADVISALTELAKKYRQPKFTDVAIEIPKKPWR
jgi:hypothetical protein